MLFAKFPTLIARFLSLRAEKLQINQEVEMFVTVTIQWFS